MRVAHYKIQPFRRAEVLTVSAYWTSTEWPTVDELAHKLTQKTKRHDLSKLEFVMHSKGVELNEDTWPVLQKSLLNEINITVSLTLQYCNSS